MESYIGRRKSVVVIVIVFTAAAAAADDDDNGGGDYTMTTAATTMTRGCGKDKGTYRCGIYDSRSFEMVKLLPVLAPVIEEALQKKLPGQLKRTCSLLNSGILVDNRTKYTSKQCD